jgi:hypothetical protein
VRLAVLVLAARALGATGLVDTTSRELGLWLGLSASRMQSMVLPGLRRSGVVTTTTRPGEFGEHRSLRYEVLPLRAARSVPRHPLALSPEELAAWLRLVEALMAPRQSSRDGEHTSAGLLNGRTGRGASKERLALLLLVLEAAEGEFNWSSQHLDLGGVRRGHGGLEFEDQRCSGGSASAVAR